VRPATLVAITVLLVVIVGAMSLQLLLAS